MLKELTSEIIAIGTKLHHMGLAPATSGNYSAKIDDTSMLMTVSGRHKGMLTADDLMRLTLNGQALEDKKPSAEMALHVMAYQNFPEARAVLHTHTRSGVVLARKLGTSQITFKNLEILKAFPGVMTHDVTLELPVFANTQDMDVLAVDVAAHFKNHKYHPHPCAFMIDGHGLTVWGGSLQQVFYLVEAYEYLFEVSQCLI